MAAWGNIKKYLKVFLAASCIALSVRLFILEDFRIASGSMSPNLLSGDLVLVWKSSFNLRIPFSTYELFRFRLPRRGEIVAFNLPGRGHETYVKRVVAVEGDRLQIKNGQISVNGAAASYRKIEGSPVPTRQVAGGANPLYFESLSTGEEHVIRMSTAGDYGPIDIPKGQFFALGDNRPESTDCRSWGPLPLTSLQGRVAYIWLSVDGEGELRSGRAGTSFP